ncbi:MAG: hypothetical protein LBV16_05595, partial [Elusimicrobiota bacterium]|nr:hypothetical protein [Elusimicrobiota bacterium]
MDNSIRILKGRFQAPLKGEPEYGEYEALSPAAKRYFFRKNKGKSGITGGRRKGMLLDTELTQEEMARLGVETDNDIFNLISKIDRDKHNSGEWKYRASDPQQVDLFGNAIEEKKEPPTFETIKAQNQDMFALDQMEMRKGEKQQGLMFDIADNGKKGKFSVGDQRQVDLFGTGQADFLEILDNPKVSEEASKLAKDNIKIAASLAQTYSGNNTNMFDELMSAGAEGLIEAAQKYDSSKGKFSTFAFPTVRG